MKVGSGFLPGPGRYALVVVDAVEISAPAGTGGRWCLHDGLHYTVRYEEFGCPAGDGSLGFLLTSLNTSAVLYPVGAVIVLGTPAVKLPL